MVTPTVVVFGYGELGIAAAQALTDAGARFVALVVPSNRSGDDVDRIVAFAAKQGFPVWVQPPRRAVEPFVRQLRSAAPDVMVVWSYSMILPQDVLDVAPDVLRHRLLVTYEAEAEEITAEGILDRVLAGVPAP